MISFTINTDASFSHRYKRGAYAYWIKGDNFSARDSGMFKQELPSASIAELLAFEKALQVINAEIPKEYRGAVLLHVNTDCVFVIRILEGTSLNKNPKYKMIIKAVAHVASEYKIIARHVKAHTDDLSEARTWVNDWCDKAAKAEMGKELYFEDKEAPSVRSKV